MKIGIMGCGVISNQYIKDIQRLYKNLEIYMVADIRKEIAEQTARENQIPFWGMPEQMLDSSDVELVVNLTPPTLHTEMNRKILLAGKHVYCEKPFAISLEEALEIQNLAKQQGLAIGCAPDTFLGSSISTCKKLIEDGWIGSPLYVCANMLNSGVETWHPRPEPFYEKGGGPLYDMGPYYFSALVTLFGPVKSVFASARKGFLERTIYTEERFGHKIAVNTPTHFAVIVEMEKGILANMNFSFDIFKSTMPLFEIYGTDGTMEVPNPNMAGGTPKIYRREQMLAECFGGADQREGKFSSLPELYQNIGVYVRGAGVQDMVCKLHRNEKEDAQLAVHVIDIITSILKSAETDMPQNLVTSCKERG
ncbi:Gfo/Idh/MocA family protein [Clostridium porci]|uniref:Gfo/Idh/MocA family oxidoreductase n=1 Tax=Clostridium porci TaxID=2605778 RepID=A0A7X2TE19_9CLOT|nr:Gfo/Idh/MocA family oxidoreductase [Clostridium porci]MCI7181168.1 Gfo/Idh/MocA family oxidoreductase [Lachnospiraceae bacterium]MSS37733.1 Gfo/Idh/MocA family oxidoreductase [Clostridium porci]